MKLDLNIVTKSTEKPRTLGYKVARDLSALEVEMVSGGKGVKCESADSSWCSGCDGRCSVADC